MLSYSHSFPQLYDLGLEKEILAVPRSHPAAQNRFVYSRGKLHQLPSGVKAIISKNALFSKSLLPLILREPFVRKKQDDADESVYNFFKRRMSEEVHKFYYFVVQFSWFKFYFPLFWGIVM